MDKHTTDELIEDVKAIREQSGLLTRAVLKLTINRLQEQADEIKRLNSLWEDTLTLLNNKGNELKIATDALNKIRSEMDYLYEEDWLFSFIEEALNQIESK